MNAIHVTSAAPALARGAPFHIPRFDLYCTALSAISWRKNCGAIDMIADQTAAGFYHNAGLCGLWDDVKALIPDDFWGIDPVTFWAGGKLIALSQVRSPVVMLDTDFIVWRNLRDYFGENVICAHREDLSDGIYPSLEYFQMNDGYVWNADFDTSALACNTAFLYLPDETFKRYYLGLATDFMKSARQVSDPICYMVFAEQRMLAMAARLQNVRIDTLLDKDRLFDQSQDSFTHLWGAKQILRDDRAETEHFCRRCRERIGRDFSDYKWVIDAIESI